MGGLQKHSYAKQEHGSTGEREKNVVQKHGNVEEKSKHAGTQRSTGMHAHLC